MAHDALNGQPSDRAGDKGPVTTRQPAAADEPEAFCVGYESADPSLHAAFWAEAADLRESP